MNDCIAVIPARGGSVGIPRKNVKPLCGKPLIGWTIEAAKAARRVSRVIVSTNDDEIASVSEGFGAEVIRRPAELSGPVSASELALLHVLDELERREGRVPAVMAFLQCTSPLTLPEDIDGTVGLVADEGYDSAVTATAFHYFIWKEEAGRGFVGVNHDETKRLMRQQRQPEFLEIGAVYAMRCAGLRERKFRFFGKIGMQPIPSSRAFEIDEPADWIAAEARLPLVKPGAR